MQKILFLYLKAFSITGGIEKVNRVIMRALHEFELEGRAEVRAASPYDDATDERYFPADRLKGFRGRRWQFMLDLAMRDHRCDTLLIGHINLAPAALLLRRRYPHMRLVVIAHGIEVWRPLSGLKLRLLREADRVLSVSEFTRQKLIELHGLAPERVAVLPNCLDPFFEPPGDYSKPAYLLERYGLAPTDKVLLTVSRLNTHEGYKGYDKVLTALTQLHRQAPDLTYLLAGRSDEAEQQRLDALIGDLGVGDRVRFTGFVPDDELVDHYRLADVFVMPSKKEGFGLVFIEAMACGTPAIGGNKDGSIEALGHGKIGHLTDPDSVASIAGAIKHVLGQPVQPAALQRKVLEVNGYAPYRLRLAAHLGLAAGASSRHSAPSPAIHTIDK